MTGRRRPPCCGTCTRGIAAHPGRSARCARILAPWPTVTIPRRADRVRAVCNVVVATCRSLESRSPAGWSRCAHQVPEDVDAPRTEGRKLGTSRSTLCAAVSAALGWVRARTTEPPGATAEPGPTAEIFTKDTPSVTHTVISFRGKPVIAIPDGPRAVRAAAIRTLHPVSLRRGALRVALNATATTRTLSLMGQKPGPDKDAQLAEDTQEWLESGVFQPPGRLFTVLAWPPQQDRGRAYIHVLDERGSSVGFAKMAFDARNNEQLAREAAIVSTLPPEGLSGLRAPRLLDRRYIRGRLVTTYEAVPTPPMWRTHAGPNLPDKVVKWCSREVSTMSASDLEGLSWWRPPVVREDGTHGFYRELTGYPRGITVARVHGDLSPNNCLRVGGYTWVVDWEEAAEDGPICTDIVSFFLSRNYRALRRDPEHWRKVLDSKAAQLSGYPRQELMAAVAFRHQRGFRDARLIIERWTSSKGWGQP
jgi:hypothetical protein